MRGMGAMGEGEGGEANGGVRPAEPWGKDEEGGLSRRPRGAGLSWEKEGAGGVPNPFENWGVRVSGEGLSSALGQASGWRHPRTGREVRCPKDREGEKLETRQHGEAETRMCLIDANTTQTSGGL